MTAYYIDEAAMELPEGLPYVDRSVNVVEVPGEEGADVGLMIERTPIPIGKSLREVVDDRDREDALKLRGYKVLEELERTVDGLPALETRLRWRHPKGPVYNAKVYVGLGGVCLTFTASCRLSRAEACNTWLTTVLSTVRFRAR